MVTFGIALAMIFVLGYFYFRAYYNGIEYTRWTNNRISFWTLSIIVIVGIYVINSFLRIFISMVLEDEKFVVAVVGALSVAYSVVGYKIIINYCLDFFNKVSEQAFRSFSLLGALIIFIVAAIGGILPIVSQTGTPLTISINTSFLRWLDCTTSAKSFMCEPIETFLNTLAEAIALALVGWISSAIGGRRR